MKNFLIFLALLLMFLSGFESKAEETRKKIVVLDTGIHVSQMKENYLCKNGVVSTSGNGATFSDDEKGMQSHGKNVVGLIGSKIDASKYCIFSVRIYSSKLTPVGYIKGLRYTDSLHNVVAVNISTSSGKPKNGRTTYIMEEHAAMTRLIQKGIKIIVAAGNSSDTLDADTCYEYPACLKPFFDELGYGKYFTVVTSKTTKQSNHFNNIVVHQGNGREQGDPPMSGSSQATAIYTGVEYSK